MHTLPGPRGHHDSFQDLPDTNSNYKRSEIAQTPDIHDYVAKVVKGEIEGVRFQKANLVVSAETETQ
ncbi:hypothetical protein L3Y34_018087 [Caenorhabditis briggsae]|uniref:Uncharacterized protein n=1 Tax=Caenorhabditis briggsae TaxID=6238 RepID=A0AAE9DL34_CAEBR|nr:hypothetical protein L3Y34_018087 [Caenorhabditis briggsae]